MTVRIGKLVMFGPAQRDRGFLVSAVRFQEHTAFQEAEHGESPHPPHIQFDESSYLYTIAQPLFPRVQGSRLSGLPALP